MDAILLLARQQPASPLQWPGWVRKGRAGFKREVTGRAVVDVEHLPYNEPLLEYLREERARGRAIYLATAADRGFAEKVAEYVGLFDGVLASDGTLNLAGANKLRAFQEMFPQGFTYIGNAMPDRTLLAASVQPMTANPHRSLSAALRRDGTVIHREFTDRRGTLPVLLKAIRLHQWAKNVLVFLPPVLAHDLSPRSMVSAAMAFFSLSFCASATYIINDLLDIEADRRHPRKRKRPFASGDLSPFTGVGIIALFFAISLALALLQPHVFELLPGRYNAHGALANPSRFVMWLGFYTVATLSYSFALKRMMLIDVIVLSGLYTVRIMAGSAATGVPVSEWLGAFSIFFFLSLAFVKRFGELELMVANNRTKASGRGYQTGDMEQLRALGTSSGFAAVVVLSMYISNISSADLYSRSNRLWLLAPIVILWISRVWMLASRARTARGSCGVRDYGQDELAAGRRFGVCDLAVVVRRTIPLLVVCALAGVVAAQSQIRFDLLSRQVVETRLKAYEGSDSDRERTLRQLFLDAGCAASDLLEHPVKGLKQPNVSCLLPGTTNQLVIVGAHFDHAEVGNGVVDNWSGAAMLPSLLQGLRGQPRTVSFWFVGFSGEEGGLRGSRSFADAMNAEQLGRTVAMVNLDTLGLGPSLVWQSQSDPVLVDLLAAVAAAQKLPLQAQNLDGVGISDEESFIAHAVCAVSVHSVTKDTFHVLHSTADNLNAIRMDDYYDTYRLMQSYLASLDVRCLKNMLAPRRQNCPGEMMAGGWAGGSV